MLISTLMSLSVGRKTSYYFQYACFITQSIICYSTLWLLVMILAIYWTYSQICHCVIAAIIRYWFKKNQSTPDVLLPYQRPWPQSPEGNVMQRQWGTRELHKDLAQSHTSPSGCTALCGNHAAAEITGTFGSEGEKKGSLGPCGYFYTARRL